MRSTKHSRVDDSNAIGLVALVMACVASACALEKGEPWGTLSVSLEVSPLIDESRWLDGLWVTSRDYLLEVEMVELDVASVAFSPTGEAITFDPSNPPEGYSLCHNGHCHHASGRLVSYDDIAREIALGGTGAPLFTIAGSPVTPEIDAVVSIPIAACTLDEACIVDAPTTLGTAVVTVKALSMSGRVFDRRMGERARLPIEGVPLSILVPETIMAETLSISFGPGEKLHQNLRLAITIPANLFDEFDWGTGDVAVAAEALSTRLARDGRVYVVND